MRRGLIPLTHDRSKTSTRPKSLEGGAEGGPEVLQVSSGLRGWGLRKEMRKGAGQDKPSGGKAHRQGQSASCSCVLLLRGVCPHQHKIKDIKT